VHKANGTEADLGRKREGEIREKQPIQSVFKRGLTKCEATENIGCTDYLKASLEDS